jgi:hypothetical protein
MPEFPTTKTLLRATERNVGAVTKTVTVTTTTQTLLRTHRSAHKINSLQQTDLVTVPPTTERRLVSSVGVGVTVTFLRGSTCYG